MSPSKKELKEKRAQKLQDFAARADAAAKAADPAERYIILRDLAKEATIEKYEFNARKEYLGEALRYGDDDLEAISVGAAILTLGVSYLAEKFVVNPLRVRAHLKSAPEGYIDILAQIEKEAEAGRDKILKEQIGDFPKTGAGMDAIRNNSAVRDAFIAYAAQRFGGAGVAAPDDAAVVRLCVGADGSDLLRQSGLLRDKFVEAAARLVTAETPAANKAIDLKF